MSRGCFDDSDFVRACRQEPHQRVPVWFMRQAGRSLPEYLAVRGEGSILDAIADPDRAAEITLQPVRRYGVDAAILFSDIVVPVHAVGFGVDVVPGTGPVVEHPFASRDDLDRLRPLDPGSDTPYVIETVRRAVEELEVPLIGFAGAPFTVASYLVEGGPSRHHERTKVLMAGDEALWHELMDRLADLAIASLLAQVEAGVSAVQLFDSWAGALSPDQYRRSVAPHSARVLEAVGETGVPRIHFGVGTGELLDQMGGCGADVVGVDFRVPIDAPAAVGRRRSGKPGPAVVCRRVGGLRGGRAVLAQRRHPGFVSNLAMECFLQQRSPIVLPRVQVVHDEARVVPVTGPVAFAGGRVAVIGGGDRSLAAAYE